jgi:SPP1 family predicted phage head-tail adaptor
MPKLSQAELDDMILATEDSFNDVCTIRADTGTSTNSYGEETDTYTEQARVACGFSYKPEYENERGQLITLDADAVLRVSLDQAIGERDQVIVRGLRWHVDGVIDGRTARIVALKKTEDVPG